MKMISAIFLPSRIAKFAFAPSSINQSTSSDYFLSNSKSLNIPHKLAKY